MSDTATVTATKLEKLGRRLAAATGRDRDLDRAVAQVLDEAESISDPAAYTASVDRCLDLLQRRLAGWRWHLGYDARGIMPYAVLTNAALRCEATAATVPLALLRAITSARLATVAVDRKASPG